MFKGLFSSGSKSSKPASSSAHSEELRELLQTMTKALVDDPSKIEIEEGESDEGILFELKVSKSDLGKVIGKRGRTASAMRTILSAASRKHKIGADLKIVE
jgi:predicted RNA-binding protein YlqC (UPF0109 family)